MNDALTIFEIVTLACALVGVYVRTSTDIGKLKSRIIALENEREEIRSTLKELVTMVQEIKVMMARKGIDE